MVNQIFVDEPASLYNPLMKQSINKATLFEKSKF